MKELGPGISAYHQLLVTLFVLFFIFFVFYLLVMGIYSGYKYYDGDKDVGFYITHSLGNMGFSQTKCQSHSLQKRVMESIVCKDGRISTLVDWGFQTIYENQLKCHRTDENTCSKYLDQEGFVNFYAENCFGEVSCTIEDLTRFIMNGTK
jgi:hypothetical protein